MASSFRVKKQFIKWKGVVYNAGDELPESYTERVWHRDIHQSWVEAIPPAPPVVKPTTPAKTVTQAATAKPKVEAQVNKESATSK